MPGERFRDSVSAPKNPGPRYSRKHVTAYEIEHSILVCGPEHPGLAEAAPGIGGEAFPGPAWLFPRSARPAVTELYRRLFPEDDKVPEPGPDAGPKVRMQLHDAPPGAAPLTHLLPAAEAIALLAGSKASVELPDDHQSLVSWARERFCSLAEEVETYSRALRCLETASFTGARRADEDTQASGAPGAPEERSHAQPES